MLRWFWFPILLCSLSFTTLRADSELQAVRVLLQAGEYLTALVLLEDLNVLRPCDADLLLLLARVYEATGETDTAISVYQTLISNFPNLPEPYNNIAVLYAARGKIEKAKELLIRGLSTNNSYRRLQKNLSTLYVVEAAEAYRRALSLDDEHRASHESKLSTPRLLTADALLRPLSRFTVNKHNSECKPTKR